METLEQLAMVIRNKNTIDSSISSIINRPALIGHAGEYIASHIFNIKLEPSASAKIFDGRFTIGKLKGKSVNIKWYAKMESLLDLNTDTQPEYYLVMTGPVGAAASSRGYTRPWLLQNVYLFDAAKLIENLSELGITPGPATSIRKEFWHESQAYPEQISDLLVLTSEQKRLLGLFNL